MQFLYRADLSPACPLLWASCSPGELSPCNLSLRGVAGHPSGRGVDKTHAGIPLSHLCPPPSPLPPWPRNAPGAPKTPSWGLPTGLACVCFLIQRGCLARIPSLWGRGPNSLSYERRPLWHYFGWGLPLFKRRIHVPAFVYVRQRKNHQY